MIKRRIGFSLRNRMISAVRKGSEQFLVQACPSKRFILCRQSVFHHSFICIQSIQPVRYEVVVKIRRNKRRQCYSRSMQSLKFGCTIYPEPARFQLCAEFLLRIAEIPFKRIKPKHTVQMKPVHIRTTRVGVINCICRFIVIARCRFMLCVLGGNHFAYVGDVVACVVANRIEWFAIENVLIKIGKLSPVACDDVYMQIL